MVGHNQGGGRIVGGWVVDRFSASSVKAYQIVESEKIVSRMIFQSQLWLLLMLRNFGHNNWFSVTKLFVVRIILLEK